MTNNTLLNYDKVLVCPYCMSEVNDNMTGHCGESKTHFEYAYDVENELILESEMKGTKNDPKDYK